MLATSLLGNVKITRDAQAHQKPSEDEGQRSSRVVEGIYLLHLLRRNRSSAAVSGVEEELQLKTLGPEAQAK